MTSGISRVWGIAAALIAAGIVGCGGKRVEAAKVDLPECEGPAWTCFKSGPCPFAEFSGSLCAVGYSDQISSYSLGIQAASTRARAEMGAVIKSQVDGFSRATQDSLSKAGVGEDSIQKVGDLAQNVVEVTLHGVMVPRTWYNPNAKVYFALAVIDAKTFTDALKGLKDAKGLSESLKLEIDQRAEAIADEWRFERDRKDGVAAPAAEGSPFATGKGQKR